MNNPSAPDHHSRNCTDPRNSYANIQKGNPPGAPRGTAPGTPNLRRCKALGCVKQGCERHFCKTCRGKNTNHRSVDCTVVLILAGAQHDVKKYWGKAGSGVLFWCEDDDSILLLRRSTKSDQPLTYGIPGGAIGQGGFHKLPITDDKPDDDVFWESAEREIREECGVLPSNFQSSLVYKSTQFENRGFIYKTFFYKIPLQDKEKWRIVLDKEHVDYTWASRLHVDALPLHSGVSMVLKHLLP